MTDLNELYPSKYLSAADLKGKKVTMTIKAVVIEEFEDNGGKVKKPIAYFKEGGDKGLVCNKTNAMTIARIAGKTNTDDWTGVRITLFPTMVQFGGKVTEAIRIEPPMAAVPVKELNDEIPW
ncbi:hypothetical protein [Mesorhizobium sp.]|uniref:hypothetical protein n=1 Tax=Mesorhizobium sp. TaxID=1871066 RepID=UPI0012241997|nr:hypothetical protein [Mesorhizobium sp.]TIT00215.1 MAG: hypothetical protein E5W87_19745 [Mesorhizobium sp.]